ncbi:MAG: decaprenyl-phosphate phosphoribosyltransferase [Gemmatimonadaceae bacterium]
MPETVNDRPVAIGATPSASVSGTAPKGGAGAAVGSAWIRMLRPRQWMKNFFILLPLLFSGRATDPGFGIRAIAAFAIFCVLASGVYAFNDVIDRESDQAHPVKKLRPVASGLISPGTALATAFVLLLGAVTAAFLLSRNVGVIAVTYLVINVFYGLYLKKIVIVDVFAIASFFVLRMLAGAAAVQVTPSVWLLLCGGLLALYLGFAKRRHELVLLGTDSADHRAVLSEYTMPFLDQLSVVLLAVTVVSYIMYTVESETSRQVGSSALSYSTVFVLYGVLRYLYLVHRREGGNPAETLLTDKALLADVVLWGLYCAVVLYRPFA